jgi:hypothetical protein
MDMEKSTGMMEQHTRDNGRREYRMERELWYY